MFPRLTASRAAMLVGLLAVLVYGNTLTNDFVIDDRFHILQNPFLWQAGGLKKIFTAHVWAFLGRDAPGLLTNYYRPLMFTSWYLVGKVSHTNPVGYHALNIAMHALVSMLLFLVIRRLAASTAGDGPADAAPVQGSSTSDRTALVAAALFAAHPIHVEAVTWISGLPELLSSFFSLLGFWIYLEAPRASGRGRYAREAAIGVCLLAGLLSKESAAVLPVLLVVYEAVEHGRTAPRYLRERLVAYLSVFAAALVYATLRWLALGRLLPEPPRFEGSRVAMIAGAFALICKYAALLVFPLRLSVAHEIRSPRLLDARVLAGIALVAGLLLLGVWLRRAGRPSWFAVVLLLACMLPAVPISFRQGGVWVGERFLYLASAGFCWLLAAALLRLRRGWVLAVVLVALYGGRALARNRDWTSEIAFYRHELRTEGESPQLRPLLAEAYLRRGMPREALEHAQAAVGISPGEPRAHNMLGFVYWSLQQPQRALEEYAKAAELAERQGDTVFAARALNNIASAYSSLGRPDVAIPRFRKALQLDPEYVEAWSNLGLALYSTGNLQEAESALHAAIRLNPGLAGPHSNLGLVLAAKGESRAGEGELREAIRLEPGNAETLARLGELALGRKSPAEARQAFERALALDPANQRALAGMKALSSAPQP